MKNYIVEFTLADGTKEEVEFTTDRLDWSVDQWCRNRSVSSHKIVKESYSNAKGMLYG